MRLPGQPAQGAPSPVRHPLTIDRPPHWRASETPGRVFWITLCATGLAVVAGFAFFGWAALGVLAISIGSVTAAEWLFVTLGRRPPLTRHGRHGQVLLTGLLLGMTLPATVDWHVAMLAGVVTVTVGRGLLWGLGQYRWHPVLLGRFLILVFFYAQLAPTMGPVLDHRHVFLGNLRNATVAPIYDSWLHEASPGGAEAFLLVEPLGAIREMATARALWVRHTIERVVAGRDGELGSPAGAVLFELLWDRLPGVNDALLGTVPGGSGATCAVALVIGGLFLIYHGYLRWHLVLAFLLAAAVTAAVCPLKIAGPDWTDPSWRWLPGLQFYDAMPVGPIYVVYHLLSGELLLGVFFFAGDMGTRPITTKGQMLCGLGCGVLTILLRLYLFVPGATYVAILLMNTLTPWIDRRTQPRAFGH